MNIYHGRALPRNDLGLPDFFGLPLLDWREPANSSHPHDTGSASLTPGGRIIFNRTRRPVSTCNLLARLAGLGSEVEHVG
ncbi:MAG: hypothetical protein KIS86_02600 [Devosia sp.]|nr:hypothetical protein [Devosia sp.]